VGLKTQSSYYSKPLAKIHADFNGICALCGGYVPLEEASRDHIVPRASGGGNEKQNIQLTHKKCNNLKGHDVYPLDWKKKIEVGINIPEGYRCMYCNLLVTKIISTWISSSISAMS
jgi:HNH endonuclease